MLRPLHNKVLVKEDQGSGISTGGIIVAPDAPLTGVAIAVGPGIYQEGVLIENAVKAGDKIMYIKDAGPIIEVDGESFRMMTDDCVVGIFSK